jgi:hypothetical protein
VALPRDFRTEKLELYLMCDSYIGLDQYHQIDLSDVNDYLEGGASKPRAKGLEQFSPYSQLK